MTDQETKSELEEFKKLRDVHVLWTTPLVEIIDDGIWINDHLVYKNGEYFDVDGKHYAE